MLIAKELLEAFRDSFVNLDSEPLEAATAQKITSTCEGNIVAGF